jgi:hypothetical protein
MHRDERDLLEVLKSGVILKLRWPELPAAEGHKELVA